MDLLNYLLVIGLFSIVFLGLFKNRVDHLLNKIWNSRHIVFRNCIIFLATFILLYLIGQDVHYWMGIIYITDPIVADALYVSAWFALILFGYYEILFYSKTHRNGNKHETTIQHEE